MPKIGSFSYPGVGLVEAVAVANRVAKEFNGEISVASLAKALNMAQKGGAFVDKVAGVRDYGLLDGRGTLKVTPLAERIAFPHSPDEADAAKGEAFLRVDLFQRLFDRTGGRLPEEESFTIFLQDVTAANRMDVAKRAATVRRLYADGVPFARAALERKSTGEATVQQADDIGRGVRPHEARQDTIELFAGDVELKLPRSPESIDIIVGVLNMMKRQIEVGAEASSVG